VVAEPELHLVGPTMVTVTSESIFLKSFEEIPVYTEEHTRTQVVIPIWLLVTVVLLLTFMVMLSASLITLLYRQRQTIEVREKALIENVIEAQMSGIELPESLGKLTRNIKTGKVTPTAANKKDEGKGMTRYAKADKVNESVQETCAN